jgi:hypothetical protein
MENGWELRAVKDKDGSIVVPTVAAAMEFVFLVRKGNFFRTCEKETTKIPRIWTILS